ncbi:hypothetical protein NA57DRAFT_56611 [Rhizodiscina lignyota]|uniref:Uncharacterized protein n=1 Tax=Rhizodiscina lignyota TaxID=1504668 RepID=A0A9P4MAQ6_9PEZI|nr:hypothetical protein NA57DRAFT_56611 [Rhizodiscina lignyota]
MKSVAVLSTITALAAAQISTPPGQNTNIGINPNPNRNFDPATNSGNLGPFTVSTAATAVATGGPQPNSVDPATAQAMQLAIRNWMADTTLVSQFLNDGKSVTDNTQFQKIADGAFKAEVDELTNKAVLDSVIGLDPRVSIANQTLTNGCFQSVVDNLQIMSFQGTQKSSLIDITNKNRCTQVLPSIDTYMIVAAEYIQASGQTAFQARAARPDACASILAAAANDATQIAPLPGTPFGTPKGTGDGNVPGLAGLTITSGGTANLGIQSPANYANGTASGGSSSGSAADASLPNQTTQQLGLPGFPNQGSGGSPNGQSQNGNTVGSTPPGLASNSNPTSSTSTGSSSSPSQSATTSQSGSNTGSSTGSYGNGQNGGQVPQNYGSAQGQHGQAGAGNGQYQQGGPQNQYRPDHGRFKRFFA